MTPVAKWTRINKDRSYVSGNGWLQNSSGTWTYDIDSKQFIPTETNGIRDEFGAFIVSFSEGKMKWEINRTRIEVVLTFLKKLSATSCSVSLSFLACSCKKFLAPSVNVEPGTTAFTVTRVPFVV